MLHENACMERMTSSNFVLRQVILNWGVRQCQKITFIEYGNSQFNLCFSFTTDNSAINATMQNSLLQYQVTITRVDKSVIHIAKFGHGQ